MSLLALTYSFQLFVSTAMKTQSCSHENMFNHLAVCVNVDILGYGIIISYRNCVSSEL